MKRIISMLIMVTVLASGLCFNVFSAELYAETEYRDGLLIISGSGAAPYSDVLLRIYKQGGSPANINEKDIVYYNIVSSDSSGRFSFNLISGGITPEFGYNLICSEADLRADGKIGDLREKKSVSFGKPVSYGSVLTATNCVKISTTLKDGVPIGATVVPGYPTYLNIVNLNTMELMEAHVVPDASSAAHMNDTHESGDIYFGTYTKARLYRYSPSKGEVEDLGRVFSEGAVISMCFDEENVYLGTYPSAMLIRYSIKDGTFTKIADVSNTDQYLSALAYHDGKFYYQTMNNNEGLYVLDEATGETYVIPFPEGSITGAEKIHIRGKYLVLQSDRLLLYDLEKKEWYNTYGESVQGQYVTPVYNNCIYYLDGGYFYRLNLNTGKSVKLGLTYGSYMRGGGFVELSDPDMPGLSYINIAYSGTIQAFNFSVLKSKSYPGILKAAASETRDFVFGPDERLYVGEYMGTKAAVFDIKDGDIEYIHMSQPEGITVLGDKMYFGTYTKAVLYILDTTAPYHSSYDKYDPGCNPRIWGETGEAQDRPFLMTTAENKVIQGSIPDYGELGGAISIYDPETDKMDVYRNFCPNQSPVSIAYNDGKLYVGTSVSGGLGVYPSETRGRIVVFDMEARKVIASKELTIPGNSSPIKGVEGLAFAPDNTLVGYGRGYMFKMDPENLELMGSKIWGTVNYGDGMQIWKPYSMLYDEMTDRYYISLDGKLAVFNYRTLEYELTGADMPANAKWGPDGNIWYIGGSGYEVMKLPVFRGDEKIRAGKFPVNQKNEALTRKNIAETDSVSVSISRRDNFNGDARIYAAFYDGDNKLVASASAVAAEWDEEVKITFEKSLEKAEKLKIFIWSSKGMMPVSDVYEYDIN